MFDLFKLGGELLDSFSAAADMDKSRKDYPQDYPIFNYLFFLFLDKGLEQIKIPEKLDLVSRKQLKGLSYKHFDCLASIDPGKNVTIFFSPVEKLPTSHALLALEFASQVNLILQAGRISIRNLNINGIPTLSIDYRTSIEYGRPAIPGKVLLGNMLQDGLDIIEYLPNAIQALQRGTTAEVVVKSIVQGRKPLKSPSPQSQAVLLSRIYDFLINRAIKFEQLENENGYVYNDDTNGITKSIVINKNSYLIFKASIKIRDQPESYERVKRFNQIINNFSPMGAMTLDEKNNCINYITSVNCRGVEEKIDSNVLSWGYDENQLQSNLWLPTASIILQGVSLHDAFETTFQSDSINIEFQEFIRAFLDFMNWN